jgi:hypothetical protein
MTDAKGRGRPKIPGAKKAAAKRRKIEQTSISVPKEVRDGLNDYRTDLSAHLGVELTIAQALKYLISNAELPTWIKTP